MKRFAFRYYVEEMMESDAGEWVRFEDAEAEIDALRNQLNAMRIEWKAVLEQNKRLRGGHQRIGKTTPPTEGGWDD